MSYRIVTDTSCDFPQEMYAQLGLTAVPLSVNYKNETHTHYTESWLKELYAGLRAGEPATTSAANPQDWESIIRPILVLGVICLIVSGLLAVTNGVTAPIIELNNIRTTQEAYLSVLPEGTTAEDLTELTVNNTEKVGAVSAVKTSDGAYAVKSTGKGFDGALITTILGFDADGNICGIWSDSSTQTAGMGSKCDDPSFTQQFLGLGSDAEITLNVDVQQVSGSTVSSVAFVDAVNSAIACYNEVKGAA